MIDARNFFDQSANNNIWIFENIRKDPADQGDDYINGFSWDYPNLKGNYKLIAIDLSRQRALDADPKVIQ